ncbi:MAG: ankyrin repeat domain-containing protein [Planctomycetes bacterium]|nr:ankyrin repeat domain-containing protein [Planctomycetota bacterium]
MGWQLHAAAVKGDLKWAQRALAEGASVHEHDEIGWAPIHHAAAHGHPAMVEFLLDQGANINDRDGNEGYTPLIQAALSDHLDVVQVLMKRGADVHRRDKHGRSALMMAHHVGNNEMIEIFEDAGATLTEAEKESLAAEVSAGCFWGCALTAIALIGLAIWGVLKLFSVL